MTSLAHTRSGRVLACVLTLGIAELGCAWSGWLPPESGSHQYQEPGFVEVPGALVNAAGGNLLVEQRVMSIDTLIGTREIRAVYNSASGGWRWSFESSYDGSHFVDPSGARHRVLDLADGEPIPGTVWQRGDVDTIESRGGLGFHFDASGRLDHIAWRHAAYPRIEYAWSAAAVGVSQCAAVAVCTAFYEITLDAEGRPTSIVDTRSGRTALASHDPDGRLGSLRTAADVAAGRLGNRFEYGAADTLLTALVNSEGERVEYRYQPGRRIREVVEVGEGDPTHMFTFGSAGPNESPFTALHVNPVGGRTRYSFDEYRRLHRVERVDTQEIRDTEWVGLRPSRRIAANGAVTDFLYAGDLLLSRSDPTGNVVVWEYEPGAVDLSNPWSPPLRRKSDSLGLVEERGYDALGRPDRWTNGEGESWTASYGPVAIEQITRPDGVVRGFPLYGVHGHWLEMTGGEVPEPRAFDPVGNPRIGGVLDRSGGVLAQRHDADRRLTSIDVAETVEGAVVGQATVTIERRSDGRLLSITRPGGGDHAFDYDSIGRVLAQRERVDGAWHATTFEYDAAGYVIARERPNGMREEFDYDPYGRIVAKRALRDGVVWGQIAFTRQLDRLVSAVDSRHPGTETYTYDPAGRRVSTTFASGEVLTTCYDVRSRVTSETFSHVAVGLHRTISYDYDLADRRTALASDVDPLLIERVFTQGRLVEERYGNGLVRSYGYAASGALVSSTTVDSVGAPVEDTTLATTIDVSPTRLQIDLTRQTSLASTQESYWLGLPGGLGIPDRAVGKRVFGWATASGSLETWAYDELSNRGEGTQGDWSVYNAERNRLVTVSSAGQTLDYVYDEAGFATTRAGTTIEWTPTGRLADFGEVALEWDLRNRLIAQSLPGQPTTTLSFGGRVASNGNVSVLHLQQVSLQLDGPERRFRHLDFRTNVAFVSDENATVIEHFRYGAYGVAASHGAEPSASFVGRSSLGDLMLVGARIYDPAVGRFLSSDPILNPINQYAYALGNPVWFADPGGEEMEPLSPVHNAAASTLSYSLTIAGVILSGPPAGAAAAVVTGVAIGFSGFYLAYALAEWLSAARF